MNGKIQIQYSFYRPGRPKMNCTLFQTTNNELKRGRSRKLITEESLNKKKKYEHERKCNGEAIPDEQPLLVSGGVMRDYQLKGYQWMATLYENGINGKFIPV